MEPPKNQESHPTQREIVQLEITPELSERLRAFANKHKVTPAEALERLLHNVDKAERRASNSIFAKSLESNQIAIFTSVMFITGMILALIYILRK